jgi:hypothetical protein
MARRKRRRKPLSLGIGFAGISFEGIDLRLTDEEIMADLNAGWLAHRSAEDDDVTCAA